MKTHTTGYHANPRDPGENPEIPVPPEERTEMSEIQHPHGSGGLGERAWGHGGSTDILEDPVVIGPRGCQVHFRRFQEMAVEPDASPLTMFE